MQLITLNIGFFFSTYEENSECDIVSMASLEKLVKAFETLKVFQPEGVVLDPK